MNASSPWWETFFDQAYVDAWGADGAFDRTEEDVPQLVKLLGLPPGARVLDIPCGFGRFAGPLHDAGYDVTGIDASTVQIELARNRHPGPEYAVGDMRSPPPGPFDAILNLYSSFGYFDDPEDDRRCLTAWHGALRPGGTLVIETMHRDRLAWLWGEPLEPGTRKEEGWTDWRTGVRTSTVELGGQRREFRCRLYSVTEYIGMLEEAGFADIDIFGGLDASPFDPSTRLTIRARRS